MIYIISSNYKIFYKFDTRKKKLNVNKNYIIIFFFEEFTINIIKTKIISN